MPLPSINPNGSEFDVVIMVVPPTSPMLITRNLLYTGITRAKKLIVIVGMENIVDFMIQNVDVKKRNTGLTYKMRMIKKEKYSTAVSLKYNLLLFFYFLCRNHLF